MTGDVVLVSELKNSAYRAGYLSAKLPVWRNELEGVAAGLKGARTGLQRAKLRSLISDIDRVLALIDEADATGSTS